MHKNSIFILGWVISNSILFVFCLLWPFISESFFCFPFSSSFFLSIFPSLLPRFLLFISPSPYVSFLSFSFCFLWICASVKSVQIFTKGNAGLWNWIQRKCYTCWRNASSTVSKCSHMHFCPVSQELGLDTSHLYSGKTSTEEAARSRLGSVPVVL